MDSFEFNKIAGAILGTLLLIMSLGIISEAIFHRDEPEKPGYIVEVAQTEETSTATAKPTLEPIDDLLLTASVEAGQGVARKCSACHSFEEGGANKVGPNLWDMINAKPGSRDGFNYSSAMVAFGEANMWDYETMSAFLASPRKYVDGTSMSFAGLKKAKDRADMIFYLRSLSGNPAPLPQPTAADDSSADADTTSQDTSAQ